MVRFRVRDLGLDLWERIMVRFRVRLRVRFRAIFRVRFKVRFRRVRLLGEDLGLGLGYIKG